MMDRKDHGEGCDHPDFVKERQAGMQTGDWKCKICGRVFSPAERKAIEAKRGEHLLLPKTKVKKPKPQA